MSPLAGPYIDTDQDTAQPMSKAKKTPPEGGKPKRKTLARVTTPEERRRMIAEAAYCRAK